MPVWSGPAFAIGGRLLPGLMVMFFVAEVVVVPSLTVSLKCTVPGVAGAANVGVSVVGLFSVTRAGQRRAAAPGAVDLGPLVGQGLRRVRVRVGRGTARC